MNNTFQYLAIIGLLILVSCAKTPSLQEHTENSQELIIADNYLIPINYDFENLGLHLNTLINDQESKIEWRWDYLNSDNSMPDATGTDYYMNLSQPVFSFNDETSLPSLSVKTHKNKIIEFSATIIFHLPNQDRETLELLIDQLTVFDLFDDKLIRTTVIEKGAYHFSSSMLEEEILLRFSEEENEYDRITYRIRKISH